MFRNIFSKWVSSIAQNINDVIDNVQANVAQVISKGREWVDGILESANAAIDDAQKDLVQNGSQSESANSAIDNVQKSLGEAISQGREWVDSIIDKANSIIDQIQDRIGDIPDDTGGIDNADAKVREWAENLMESLSSGSSRVQWGKELVDKIVAQVSSDD
ncbi:hypothetical protein LJC71_11055, partial [Desulfosarcina sp. OttesenSCG-928-A07]|nr:hypothetical protein [Desulfosarcina sp. OttesenSCG-928-A07]